MQTANSKQFTKRFGDKTSKKYLHPRRGVDTRISRNIIAIRALLKVQRRVGHNLWLFQLNLASNRYSMGFFFNKGEGKIWI